MKNNLIKTPLVTVYITNHNYGKYLSKSIKSVLNQSFKDFELIIIDDGSIDNSKEILKKYEKNKKIKIIFQKNKGLIISNNLALRLAKGKYIMRLDADDWLDTYAIEIMSNVLEKNSKVGLVFPDFFIVDKSGEIINSVRRHDFRKVRLFDQPAHGACTMVRKENLRDIGGYDEEFNCQDGYYLWLRFIKKYLVRNINLPLFYYRQHGESLSKKKNKILKNRSNIIKKILLKEKKTKRKVLAILPIRGLKKNPYSFVLRKIKKKILLFYTIDNLLKCKSIKYVAVTTPDENLIKILKKEYKKKIILIKRSEKLASINTETKKTFKHALNSRELKNANYDLIMDVSYNTPFISASNFDNAINTLQVFDADKVIPVTQETHRYFKHGVNGLRNIIKNSNLKLERDVVYKHIYGFNLYKKSKFNLSDNQLKISHIVLNKKESFEFRSEEDLELLNFF